MTTKKLLSIILAVVMIFSTTVAASAAATVIEPRKNYSITASLEKNPVFTFVPEETKEYIVTSYAPEDIDPYCIIETENESLWIDDAQGTLNFAEKYTFEAGVEYTLTVGTYSEEDATFDFALVCTHSWTDDTCDDCGLVCDHSTEGKAIKICDCGKVDDVAEIKLGDTIKTAFNGFAPLTYKFVPEEDVTAVLFSDVFDDEHAFDINASIYNAAGDKIAYDDDFCDSFDFAIWYEFKAGEKYYFEIGTYYEDLYAEIFFVKAVHTVDDEEHDVIYVDSSDGTCIVPSYTEGFYCAECDEYLAGHSADGYGCCCDDDWDDICDYCGEAIDYGESDDDADDESDVVTDDATDEETGNYIKLFMEFSVKIVDFFRNLFLNFFRLFYNR